MPKPRNPAPFSHLYGKKVRHPHVFAKCPMRGCDNCQCLLCGASLERDESNACRKCYVENDFDGYTQEEIHDWFVSLVKLSRVEVS